MKTVVLTGACGGIGCAIAGELASRGYGLILVGRSEERLQSLRAEITAINPVGHKHGYIVADILQSADRQKIVDYCRQRSAGIHGLINNAGISNFGFLADADDDMIEAMLMTNTVSVIQLTRALLPLLLGDGDTSGGEAANNQLMRSCIVNIGSTFGSIGFAGFSSYCASKFALRGFTEALRRELSDKPVNIHYVAPRTTDTVINDDNVCAMNKELGNAVDDPAVVATLVAETVAVNHSSVRYIGWPEKLFIRINSIFPGLVDGALAKKLAIIQRYSTRRTK